MNLNPGDVPVRADPELEDAVLACDKRRLVRILANYLNNAEKYADGATCVFVERHDPDQDDDPQGQTTVRISVEDAGSGVPEIGALAHLRPLQPRRPGRKPGRGHRGRARVSPWPRNTPGSRGVGCGSRTAMTGARVRGSWSSSR